MKNINISEYDLYDYDYENYWKQGREYEHYCDQTAIQSFLKNETGDWFIDLGGSYGRLVPNYRTKFLHCVLSDYSIEALKKAKKRLKDQRIQNVELVALNFYNIPFKDNVFDGGQTIRVLHHIEKPDQGIKEISRVIKNKGFFILEFANKIHFMAKLKNIFRFNFGFIFNKDPYRQPSQKTKQGSKDEGLFYNFHPKNIKDISQDNNFKIEKKRSVSNLRIPIIKKLIPTKLLFKLESILQVLLSFTTFGPSQYRKLRKTKGNREIIGKSINEIICCPKCRGELIQKKNQLVCQSCKQNFPITYGIKDLRWPRPTKKSNKF